MEYIKAEFVERIKRSEDVESFRFFPQERINFLPGQFLRLIFDRENKRDFSLNKYLSFSSAPGKDYIEVTKKMSSSLFSKSLIDLKQGDEVLINGPLGNCIFKPEYKKTAFFAGGVGITPAISILEYIYENRLSTDAVLIYSNRAGGYSF